MKNKLIKKKISIVEKNHSPFSIVKLPKKHIQKKSSESINLKQLNNDLKKNNSLKKIKRINKYRKYDVDSMKKLLKKNLWNNVHKKVSEFSKISHVKSKDKDFKTKTLKSFEVGLLRKTISTIYKDNYDLDEEDFKKKMIENKPFNQLKMLLDKSLGDYFKVYRNSLEFFSDAVTSAKGDYVKLKKYLKLGRCYLTYLQKEKHTNLENTKDDPDLTDQFHKKYEHYINNNNIIKTNHNSSTNDVIPTCKVSKPKKNDTYSVITMKDFSVSGNDLIQDLSYKGVEQQFQERLNSILKEMQSKLEHPQIENILKNTFNNYLPQRIFPSSDNNPFAHSNFNKFESKPCSFNSVRSVGQAFR